MRALIDKRSKSHAAEIIYGKKLKAFCKFDSCGSKIICTEKKIDHGICNSFLLNNCSPLKTVIGLSS